MEASLSSRPSWIGSRIDSSQMVEPSFATAAAEKAAADPFSGLSLDLMA